MKTKDSFIELRDKLKKYNKQYYNSNPTINDSQYDDLKKKYDYLLKQNPELKKIDNLGIGTTPSSKFEKFKHYEPMLSLSNSFNLEDLEDFFEKAGNFLKMQNPNYTFNVDCKIDGVSLSLLYKDNYYLKPLHEEMELWERILHEMFWVLKVYPRFYKIVNRSIEIRGEVFFMRKDFEKLNNQFEKITFKPRMLPQDLYDKLIKSLKIGL